MMFWVKNTMRQFLDLLCCPLIVQCPVSGSVRFCARVNSLCRGVVSLLLVSNIIYIYSLIYIYTHSFTYILISLPTYTQSTSGDISFLYCSHTALCTFQCARWHSLEQYFNVLHCAHIWSFFVFTHPAAPHVIS